MVVEKYDDAGAGVEPVVSRLLLHADGTVDTSHKEIIVCRRSSLVGYAAIRRWQPAVRDPPLRPRATLSAS